MNKKLNYNEFKELLINDVKEKLPQYEIVTNQVHKNNVIKDGLCGIKDHKKLAPTLYINEFYIDYNDNDKSYKEVLQNVMNIITYCEDDNNKITVECNNAMNILSKLNDLEHNVMPRVVCTKTNTDLLDNVIHRDFLDMSIYYVIQIKVDDGVASVKMTEDLLKSKGITVDEEQLFKWSINNLKEYNNYVISMPKMINCIMYGLNEKDFIGYDTEDLMLVIKNDDCNGANNILNVDLIKEISDTINSDLYILPSSIHELIVLPTDIANTTDMSVNELKEMVREVNTTTVDNEDVLTDTVYLYSRNTNKVTIAEQ